MENCVLSSDGVRCDTCFSLTFGHINCCVPLLFCCFFFAGFPPIFKRERAARATIIMVELW